MRSGKPILLPERGLSMPKINRRDNPIKLEGRRPLIAPKVVDSFDSPDDIGLNLPVDNLQHLHQQPRVIAYHIVNKPIIIGAFYHLDVRQFLGYLFCCQTDFILVAARSFLHCLHVRLQLLHHFLVVLQLCVLFETLLRVEYVTGILH